jgi:hypothetical protein
VSTGLTIGVVVIGVAIIGGVVLEYPELKRYLKIRSM